MTSNQAKPKVSIIIPVYNGAAFIGEAVESALAQDYNNIEVVVVNDGSTDDTETVLKPYMGNIIYVKQENAGLSAARNRGILSSSGEYLAFLDADDILLPHMVSTLLPPLLADPSCGLAYGGYYMIDSDGRKFGETDLTQPSGHLFRELVKGIVIILVGSLLVRRSVLARSGLFDPMLRQLEDRDLWLRIAYYSNLVFVPVHVACYRSSQFSMSRNWQERKRASELLVRKFKLFLDAVGEPPELARKLKRDLFSHRPRQCVQDAFVHYWAGRYDLALRKMVEGVICDPRYLRNRGVVAVIVKSFVASVKRRNLRKNPGEL
ncbi:MAG: glycosyltransferase family 2 protein [Armatimonadota bacterium]